jgi:hypothetical protein
MGFNSGFKGLKSRTLREVAIIIIIIATFSDAIILVLTAAPDSVVSIVTDCELGDRSLDPGQGTGVFFSSPKLSNRLWSHSMCLTTSSSYTSNNLPRMKNQRLPVQF